MALAVVKVRLLEHGARSDQAAHKDENQHTSSGGDGVRVLQWERAKQVSQPLPTGSASTQAGRDARRSQNDGNIKKTLKRLL